MSVDLPPVGELVQITVQDADGMATGLAQLRPDGMRFDSLDWPRGIPVGLVTSWRRVLVVPDDEIVDRLAACHRSSHLTGVQSWEQWQTYAQRHPETAARYRTLVSGYAAALREAAIR